jgi:hypothetical protein
VFLYFLQSLCVKVIKLTLFGFDTLYVTASVEKAICNYFADEYISHAGISVSIFRGFPAQKLIITFPEGIDNELFIFFFTAISCENEFQKSSIKGWFRASDKLKKDSSYIDFRGSISKDSFSKVIFLNGEMTEDYTLGYSDNNEQIEFHYSGKFKINSSRKYESQKMNLNELNHVKTIDFTAQKGIFEKKKKLFSIELVVVFCLIKATIIILLIK